MKGKDQATRPNVNLKEPTDLHVRSNRYQPTKAEINEEIDMPELSLDEARDAFMRPVNVRQIS